MRKQWYARRAGLILAAILTVVVIARSPLAARFGRPGATPAAVRSAAASARPRRASSAAVPVAVATVSRADVPVQLTALGSVAAFNTVTVRPRVDGQLTRIAFREG